MSDVAKSEYGKTAVNNDEDVDLSGFKSNINKATKPIPFEAIVYQLCQLFHCLPSQLLDEDNDLINSIVTIHNVYSEVDKEKAKLNKQSQQAKVKIDIAEHVPIGVVLEKYKSK